jgi:hydroxyacylglutathione hydrolase
LIHEKERDFINFEVDKFLKEGDEIKIGEDILKVLHTPGHTPGGISLLGDGFILTGDTLFKDGYGRTDLEGGSEKDLTDSLDRLSNLLKPGMMIYPGHGEPFQIL